MIEAKFKDDIFGCYIAGPSLYYDADEVMKNSSSKKGEHFRELIWGKNGFDSYIKPLKNINYGKDITLVLFQFHLSPLKEELLYLKEIGRFRPKEKSIGIPIIIDDLFFNKDRVQQVDFLKMVTLKRMDLLEKVIKRNKLDTDIIKLKLDFKISLENYK